MDRARPAALLAALVAASSLTVGCTSTPAATSTPTPRPTFTCTPEAGGDGYPCTEADYQAMRAKDALYAEAEAVYRRYFEETARHQVDYRVAEITQVIEETTDGPYLAVLKLDYEDLRKDRVTASGGLPKLVWVGRSPGYVQDGSDVALETCVDSSHLTVFSGGRLVGPGAVTKTREYFVRIGGSLKLWTSEYVEGNAC